MPLLLNRRGFLGVLAGALAAPIVVKAANIMPVRTVLIVPPPALIKITRAHTNIEAVAIDPLKQVYRLYRRDGHIYELPIARVTEGRDVIPGYLGHAREGDWTVGAVYVNEGYQLHT